MIDLNSKNEKKKNDQFVGPFRPCTHLNSFMASLSNLQSQMATVNFRSLLVLSAIFRAILILYGEWQDTHMEVRYTDVDYLVFSDAASLMASGKSPYLRSTYRYSPLLAFLLIPNSIFHHSWGKFLFSASGMVFKY